MQVIPILGPVVLLKQSNAKRKINKTKPNQFKQNKKKTLLMPILKLTGVPDSSCKQRLHIFEKAAKGLKLVLV